MKIQQSHVNNIRSQLDDCKQIYDTETKVDMNRRFNLSTKFSLNQ